MYALFVPLAYLLDIGLYSVMYDLSILGVIENCGIQILIVCTIELLCFFMGVTMGTYLHDKP